MERGSWDVFLFYERSRKHEEHCERCPTITRIIEASNTVRTQAGLLYVSKLSPGTHIRPHRGPTNQRLRCHLGIRIPEGDCGLRVGSETREVAGSKLDRVRRFSSVTRRGTTPTSRASC